MSQHHPIYLVEGPNIDRLMAVEWLRGRMGCQLSMSAVPLNATVEQLMGEVLAAVQMATRGPVVIDGGWLTRAVKHAAAGVELEVGGQTIGRVLERLCHRYGVQRWIARRPQNEHRPMFPLEDVYEDRVYATLTSTVWISEDIPVEITGHQNYLAFCMATSMIDVDGWTIVDPADDRDLWEAAHAGATRQAHVPAFCYDGSMSWYGAIDPELVIVGDRYNPESSSLRYPFGKASHSASYLNHALNLAGAYEDQLAYVNLHDEGGPDHLLRMIRRSPIDAAPPIVIALGADVKKTLVDLGVSAMASIVNLPHPQWVRRFHHGRLDDYADRLRVAMVTDNTDMDMSTQPIIRKLKGKIISRTISPGFTYEPEE